MSRISPERRACFAILRDWQPESGDYLEQIIEGECRADPGLNRAFILNMCFGVGRNISLLDHWIEHLTDGPRRLDSRTRWLCRQGLYELRLTTTADHAAVNETVSMGGKARGLTNALLRRAIREADLLDQLTDEAPLAIRFSHPEFLVDRWTENFGATITEEVCKNAQRPSEVFVRENLLKPPRSGALEEFGEPLADHPGFWRVNLLPRELLSEGQVYAQDPSTIESCILLQAEAGHRVLDTCAAPGGKTALVAQMMENRGEIVATDPKPQRLKRLGKNLDRLGVKIANCIAHEWGEQAPEDEAFNGGFDRILIDAPCTNSGVLRRRVDARWRLRPSDFDKMAELQSAILADTAQLLRPKGRLVYSTCSIDHEENRAIVDAFIDKNPDWVAGEERLVLPRGDAFDGAYAVALERKS